MSTCRWTSIRNLELPCLQRNCVSTFGSSFFFLHDDLVQLEMSPLRTLNSTCEMSHLEFRNRVPIEFVFLPWHLDTGISLHDEHVIAVVRSRIPPRPPQPEPELQHTHKHTTTHNTHRAHTNTHTHTPYTHHTHTITPDNTEATHARTSFCFSTHSAPATLFNMNETQHHYLQQEQATSSQVYDLARETLGKFSLHDARAKANFCVQRADWTNPRSVHSGPCCGALRCGVVVVVVMESG